MDKICQDCWNDGCKCDEKLRQRKIDVCRDMNEHPEDWNEDLWVPQSAEYDFWDDRTYS